MNDPLISVIMPAYNCEQYIGQAIDSVLNQTYLNWELIIINDASTDDTDSILRRYSDKRIRIISNDINKGVAYNRNTGAKVASGDWIAFLDSDDIWEQDKLKQQVQHMSETKDGKLFFTGSSFITDKGEKLNYILHVPETITRNDILQQNLISCSSVLVWKDLFLKYPMPEIIDIHEDFVSWLTILKEEKYAYGLDNPLLIYRIQSTSKSGNKILSARMQWNSYMASGESIPSSAKNLISYTMHGLKKYKQLRIG